MRLAHYWFLWILFKIVFFASCISMKRKQFDCQSGFDLSRNKRTGPPHLQRLFTQVCHYRRSSPRYSMNRFALVDSFNTRCKDYLKYSTLGYIGVFNLIPDDLFLDPDAPDELADAGMFQKNLSKQIANNLDFPTWRVLYSPRYGLAHRPLLSFHTH